MAKKTTGSFTSRLRKIMLLCLLGAMTAFSAYAQGPASCSDVELGDITRTPATCEGNGAISAPDFEGAAYTLTGPGYSVGPQSSGTFENLSPGTYTMTISCEGATEPLEITGIVVENNWQQLSLALAPSILCPGEGTLTATASFGYNKGVGATYEFAIWQGAANLPDGSLTWVSPETGDPHDQYVFTGLTTGSYYVRVRDNCGNVWTTPGNIGSASTPTSNLNHSATWICESGEIVRRVTLNANNINAAVRWSGYKYKVEYVNNTSGSCADKTPIGTAIVPETVITEANMSGGVSFDLDDIPAGAGAYRITVTSPCGGVSSSCQSIPTTQFDMTLRRSYTSCADPNSESDTRLTYQIAPTGGYAFQYPATLVLTGQGGWTSGTITIADGDDLTGVLENVPNSAYTISALFTDGCGATRTVTIGGLGALATSAPTPSYTRNCADLDHVNVNFTLNGNYLWGQSYVLHNETHTVSIAGSITNTITNTVTFPNVPAGDSYHFHITPASGSDCGEQELGPFTIPGGSNGEGARIMANPKIEENCNNNTSMWAWGYSSNYPTSGASYRFKVWKVSDDPVAGPFVHNSTSSSNFSILPGEYLWSIELDYAGTECDRIRTGTVPVVVNEVQWIPTIEKSVASVCQDENGQPLTTGSVILEFAGNGPFHIEQRDAANPNVNSWTTVPGGEEVEGPTYSINNLEAGKTYIFRVTDQCGRSATQQASIKPLSPRIISRDAVQPCVNENYVLEGVDYPGAAYVWTRVSDNQVVSTTKNLTFTPYTAADAGQYKLTLTLGTCSVRETTITLGTTGCNQPFQLGSLGDFVWYDTDYDGLQDESELPAPGVSVTLQGYIGPNPSNPSSTDLANGANWADMETQQTGTDGKYKFTGLEGGYYRVRFGDVPDYTYTGYQQGASDPDNRNEGEDSNADPANGNYSGPVLIEVNHPAGDVRRDNMTIDAGLVRYGSIGDYLWYDTDLDGIQDAGEAPAIGVEVELFKKEGETWVSAGTTPSDGSGKYLFDNLKPGTYKVVFDKPSGFDFTHNYIGGASNTGPSDSDANRATGESGEIVIDVSLPKGNVGRDNMTIDAGYVPEGALPVKLSHFNAEKTTEGTAHLTWSTTEETNSSYFDVLQSADGAAWQAIGRVEAKGNSKGSVRYAFTDVQPNKGLNYYRLKMVDLDGSFEHSNIRSLTFEGTPLDVTVYPNPISEKFSIKVGAREKISKVELFDSNGRRAIVSNRYVAGESIATKGLSAGTYVLKVTMANGASEIRKIVISNK